MSDEKATKTRLYTFEEMKETVTETIAEMTQETLKSKDFDDPTDIFLLETAVGGKILTYLDKKHEKGEL